jgi:hypothetical protein
VKKSTLLAALFFAVLLVGVLATLREKPERGMSRISFTKVDSQAITRLVTSGKSAVEIRKEGDTWKLADGKRADAAGVKRLLETIPRIESGNVVTQNEERFAELEVDDAKGTRIRAFVEDREVADFVVGKAARGGAHIRVDDATYAARGISPAVFVRDAAGWVDKAVFTVDPKTVERVEVQLADGTSYALVQSEEQWALEDPSILPAGFRFDPNQARTLAQSVIHARASEVLDADPGAEKTGLEKGDVFTLVSKDKSKAALALGGDNEAKNVYARADGWKELLTLPPHSARALRKAPTDLRDLTLMRANTTNAKRLEIEKDKQLLVLAKDGETWKIESSSEKVPDDFKLDPMRVTQRVASVAGSRALGVASDPKAARLDKPTAQVRVVQEDGSEAKLVFGADTKQDGRDAVFARGNADDQVYLVTTFARDDLTRGIDSFAVQPEPAGGAPGGLQGIDPAALEKLPPEVRESLLQQMQQDQQRQRLLQQMQAQGDQPK